MFPNSNQFYAVHNKNPTKIAGLGDDKVITPKECKMSGIPSGQQKPFYWVPEKPETPRGFFFLNRKSGTLPSTAVLGLGLPPLPVCTSLRIRIHFPATFFCAHGLLAFGGRSQMIRGASHLKPRLRCPLRYAISIPITSLVCAPCPAWHVTSKNRKIHGPPSAESRVFYGIASRAVNGKTLIFPVFYG